MKCLRLRVASYLVQFGAILLLYSTVGRVITPFPIQNSTSNEQGFPTLCSIQSRSREATVTAQRKRTYITYLIGHCSVAVSETTYWFLLASSRLNFEPYDYHDEVVGVGGSG